MAALLSVREICERSLRKIGSYSLRDRGADPAEMQEAMFWLDLVVSALTGTRTAQWLIAQTLQAPLAAATPSYKLQTLFASGMPADGILFPINAWVRDSSGRDIPLRLIRKQEYEDIEDKGATGQPAVVYIDRLVPTQDVFVHPVPADGSFSLRLEVQTYSPTYAKTNSDAAKPHGFSQEWQLYLITELSAFIADGPVRQLPRTDVDTWKNEAAAMLKDLTKSNREKVSLPRRTAAWGA